MAKTVRRGFVISDEKDFCDEALKKLYTAGCDLYYLINRGYRIKGASEFVGNHYLLSERQRLALTRTVSSEEKIKMRKKMEITGNLNDKTVNIDGFNTIITLEVALSGSSLLKCMDGTFRDLAGLRGTYRLIDKTDSAVIHIGKALEKYNIEKAVFYLDAPVSNSGRLKERITELLKSFNFDLQIEVINNVDTVLEKLDNVITSDAIILDKCGGWINLNKKILDEEIKGCSYIDFSLEAINLFGSVK